MVAMIEAVLTGDLRSSGIWDFVSRCFFSHKSRACFFCSYLTFCFKIFSGNKLF